MAQVVDIRGQHGSLRSVRVLADPSGGRARRLARSGRATALLLPWLAGLGWAGLGVLPAGDLPLGRAL
jgi:hypothetical protein